ncbi:MAG: sulfotransferase [Bacteroidales bacterium]|nr:sulfotransferase [Bacteroidales bacterium]
MNYRELFKLTLEDFYWLFKAGKSKRKVSTSELKTDLNKYIKSPVFFLSTGRCGTKWFSDLMSSNKSTMVLHNPKPSFANQNKLVYEIFHKKEISDSEKNLVKEIFLSGREQYLRYSYKTQKSYVETNNYISFFAPVLIKLFPDAKFIHLYRHPGEFVRSGIRRNYYVKNNPDDIKRITPTDEEQSKNWDKLSQLEKTSWLWNETNLFIEHFKKEYNANCYNFNFNELNLENVTSLMNFMDVGISQSNIAKALNKKSNVQTKGSFAEFSNWDSDQKIALKDICNDLSQKYNYTI